MFSRATVQNLLVSYAITGPVKKHRPTNWAIMAHKSAIMAHKGCHKVVNHLPAPVLFIIFDKFFVSGVNINGSEA